MVKQEGSGRRRGLASLRIIALALVLLSIGFGWGALSFRNQMFPYTLIRDALRFVAAPDARRVAHKSEIEALRSYSLGNLSSSESIVETFLLPIGLKAINLMDIEGFASFEDKRGGLCSIGRKIVVSDAKSNFAIIDLETGDVLSLHSVPLPPGPGADESTGLAWVHDVECDSNGSQTRVVVSYDVYHQPRDTFTFLVSFIDLEDLANRKFDGWKNVFSSDHEVLHWSGRLVFLDDRTIAVSVGSESDPVPLDGTPVDLDRIGTPRPQDPAEDEGKIFTVDLESGERALLSLGHRNTQGLVLDHQGRLFSTEHGLNGGDELNLIESGGNYGWPMVSHGINYGSYRWVLGEPGRHDGYTKPIFSWNPSIGISNLIEVREFADPWKNDFLISSLKANSLFRVRVNGRGLEFVEQIWLGERIRDIENLHDGRIALVTDSGKLILLSVAEKLLATPNTTHLDMNSQILEECMKCHHFGPTNPTHMAPTLSKLIDRPVGSDEFKYSQGLESLEGTWSRENLRKFISNPAAFAPGTAMAYAVTDERRLEELLDHLERINDVGAFF